MPLFCYLCSKNKERKNNEDSYHRRRSSWVLPCREPERDDARDGGYHL